MIEPDDWNLAYCLQVFKRPISAGFQITWQVLPQFVDESVTRGVADATRETVITLAQGLANGSHKLELSGDAQPSIAAIRVYRPSVPALPAALEEAVK